MGTCSGLWFEVLHKKAIAKLKMWISKQVGCYQKPLFIIFLILYFYCGVLSKIVESIACPACTPRGSQHVPPIGLIKTKCHKNRATSFFVKWVTDFLAFFIKNGQK